MKKHWRISIFIIAVSSAFVFFGKIVLIFIGVALPTSDNPTIFYSSHLNHPLRHLVLQAIKKTESSLYLHTYALTDDAVISMLLKKQSSLETLSVISDYKTIPRSFKDLQPTLHWEGIRSSGLMHEKILITDASTVFLGTANMTYESLSMHDNMIVGFYSPDLANYLKIYTHKIHEKRKHKNTVPHTFQLKNQTLQLWMLPFQGNLPLENLAMHINQAKKSISLAMFTLTHPKLIEALIRAHQNQVKVQIFLDHTSAKGASSHAVQTLQNANIPLFFNQGQQLLHHKMMLIDDTHFILGSANWTKSAFTKNHDFYFVLSPLHKNQQVYLKKIFRILTQEAI